jgi:hypothetical protein
MLSGGLGVYSVMNAWKVNEETGQLLIRALGNRFDTQPE